MSVCARCPERVNCLVEESCIVLKGFMHFITDNEVHEAIHSKNRKHAKFLVLAIQRLGELIGYDYFSQDHFTPGGGSSHLHIWKGILPDIEDISVKELGFNIDWLKEK